MNWLQIVLLGKSGILTGRAPLARNVMFNLNLLDNVKKLKVLCLGAHADDIELGCGGTILKLAERVPELDFYWVVFSGNRERAKEASESANTFLNNVKSSQIVLYDYRESYFPFIGAQIKDSFEEIKKAFSPDIVMTHHIEDVHQDHKLISGLTWNTFRNHLILEYEILKYEGDLKTPNLYVHIDESIVERKINYICDFFKTQKEKQWFSEDTFRSIMRIRGLESNPLSKYAEAFHCRKIVF
jgi:LmbE family N-acetylglucosaminyl deacetylase